jgi:lysophospholipid acyltransferase (LPLAT)-like uncharacterized protein
VTTPPLLRRFLRTAGVQWILSGLGAGYLVFVRWTSRVERPEPPPGGQFVLAMWHGRLLMLHHIRLGGLPLVALISGHRDGQVIRKIARFGHIRSTTGSTSRGSHRAVRELIRFARAGHSLFITPDGPRGPRMQAQRGVVEVARLTGLPILPVSASATRAGVRPSWDRFLIPYPFSRIVVRWGEPMSVPRDSNIDEVLARVEAALNALQESADEACGRGGSEALGTSPGHAPLAVVPSRQDRGC